MTKTLTTILLLVALVATATNALAERTLEDRIKALEKKVQTLQVNDAKDKIRWSGDLRVEAHNIKGEVPDYYDGMALQAVMVNTLFFHSDTGNLPMNPDGSFNYSGTDGVEDYIANNPIAYSAYLNSLEFADIPDYMEPMLYDMGYAMFQMTGGSEEDWNNLMSDPQAFAAYMGQVQAGAVDMMKMVDGVLQPGFKTDNDILYTTRLRLNLDAKVAENVSFAGRLSMYKPWGGSTQTGIFNGQANTLNSDVNWPGVPGDATLKVDRAYFTWNKMFTDALYLSLGRRPSTDGPPLHYRHDEVRQGTPMGTIIDMQFDGATLGYHVGEYTTLRACYGLGYESQYGNGLTSADQALKDAQFFGFNIDAYDSETMQVQTTLARAFDITDGFNGYIILPNNPVTGQPMPGPIVTRFSPSANLGDFDIASVLLSRTDGPIDWFVTGSWSKSRPVDVTGPFGGLLCDPYETPESQTGSMYYLGARYTFSNEKTKVGLEWNKGSQYWFNFAPSQDDIIAPKTGTRGTVWEGYVTHRIARKFVVKLAYIRYDYDYTGSGWHVGAPKELGGDPVIQGFPTYEKAEKLSLGFSARF